MTRALATLGTLTLTAAAVILAAAWDRERRLDRAAGPAVHPMCEWLDREAA